jgi:hypothetical protein
VVQRPEGPVLIDCKVNADVCAPFMSYYAQKSAGSH